MTLLDDIGLLSETPFFRDFPVEQLRMLAFGSERRHIAEGETLYRSDESAKGAWVIISGKINLALERNGKLEWSEIHERGSLLGETALIVPTRRFGSAFAQEDSEALLIPRTLFLTLLKANPRIARKIEARMRESVQRLAAETARAGVQIASMPPLPPSPGGSRAERVDRDGEADRVSGVDADGGAGGDDGGGVAGEGESGEADRVGGPEGQASGRLGNRAGDADGGAGGGDGVGGSDGVE